MDIRNLCRICLRSDQSLYALLDLIKPDIYSIPSSVPSMWETVARILLQENGNKKLPDQICGHCRDELLRAYSFAKKWDNAKDTIKHIRKVKVQLRKLKQSPCKKDRSIPAKERAGKNTEHLVGSMNERSLLKRKKYEKVISSSDRGPTLSRLAESFGRLTKMNVEVRLRKLKQLPLTEKWKNDQAISVNGEVFKHVVKSNGRSSFKRRKYQGSISSSGRKHTPSGLSDSLDRLTERSHFTCKICKITFGIKFSYNYHMKTHEESSVGALECPTCMTRFTSESVFKVHLLTHTMNRQKSPPSQDLRKRKVEDHSYVRKSARVLSNRQRKCIKKSCICCTV